MFLRNLLLVAFVGFSLAGMVRADDELKLPGSAISIKDVVAKADVIFEGKLTSIGTLDNSTDHSSFGPEYHGARVEVKELLKGAFDAHNSVSIYPNSVKKEVPPQAGGLYLFFIAKTDPNSGFADPFTILKLVPDTRDNFRKVVLEVLKARASAKLLEIETQKRAQDH
jgi:hypothetical protein